MNQISIYEIIAINMIGVTKGLEPFRVGISAGRKEFEIARSIALKKLSDQSKYPCMDKYLI